MGNTPITIGLRTDSSSYFAGEVVSGCVYVNITKQPQAIDSLYLRLVGEEHCVVHYTTHNETVDHEGRQRTQSNDQFEEHTHSFLQLEYPLHEFPTRQVAPGQYEFPFQLHLPAGSRYPSTMRCKRGRSYAEIRYRLVATVRKSSSSIFSPNPEAKQNLQLFSTPPESSFAGVETSRIIQLPKETVPVSKSCCCSSAGSMSLETHVSPSLLQANDKIQVQFQCSNQSTVKVKYVRVQMKEVVEWSVRGHKETVSRNLDRKDMDLSLFPELRALRYKPKRYANVEGAHTEQYDTVAAGQEQWHLSELRVPSHSYDSYMGGCNLQVRHLVSVELVTKGCCATNPDQTTLVQLFRKVLDSSQSQDVATSLDATAPPSFLDDSSYTISSTLTPTAPPDYQDDNEIMMTSSQLPLAEAQEVLSLPDNWNPSTAQVVDIPMAQAVVVDDFGGKLT